MNKKVRIALVGCGEHASETLLPSLLACCDAEIVATCDLDLVRAQSAGARAGARAYDSFAELFAREKLDAIVAACPPQIHLSLSELAVERGLHIFVEKPPTIDKDDLMRLADLAEAKGLVTAVGHNLRHSAACRVLAEEARKPSFGRIMAMETRYLVSGPRGGRWSLPPLRSFLLSHAIHAVDLMVYLLGPVKAIHSAGKSADTGGAVLMATLEFVHGAVGTLLVTSCAPRFMFDVAVISDTDKVLHVESLRRITFHGEEPEPKRWSRVWMPRTLESGYEHAGYATELQHFITAIRCGGKTHPSFRDEVGTYRIIDEIESQLGAPSRV